MLIQRFNLERWTMPTSRNASLIKSIKRLRKEMNAVILAHFYQDSEIQDIADFIGDSLDLSRKAATTDADVIIFCGVRFMAEVAKILNPSKLVIIPDMDAGCSLEDACQPNDFAAFRKQHPDHLAITYINCSAEVKALSDIIVTSTNAEHIIRSIPEDQPILFAPDRHLGAYLERKTSRKMTLWQGTCIVHETFSERAMLQLKMEHPKAHIIAHPECPEDLLAYANHIGSTSSLINYVSLHKGQDFIVLTEPGIIHQMQQKSPKSTFHAVPGHGKGCDLCNQCPYMRLNTLEKLHKAMVTKGPEITLDQDIRMKAEKSVRKMLDLSKSLSKH